MSKRDSDVIRDLGSLGFVFDHTNTKGVSFYLHEATGATVRVPCGVSEQTARSVLRDARHLIGLPTKDNKRNPAQVRARQQQEHDRAARELAKAQADLQALERGSAAIREAEEVVLRAERKYRYWDRLMREPVSVA